MTVLVVWCLVVAAVVPGVVAGVTASAPSGTAVVSDTERARGTSLDVTATPGTVAAGVGDSIELTGTTTFDTGEVRLYLVGPRGRFLDSDGTSGRLETETVTAGLFDRSYEAFTRRGTYRLLVVSPRADGEFESTETLNRDTLPTDVTQPQAVDLVRTAYGMDEVVELTLRGETPALGIDPVSADGTLVGNEVVTVTGTTNRGGGTTFFVDLVETSGRVATSAEAAVDASTGTWEADLDLTGLAPGTYTLFADDTESSASTTVIIVTEETTPAETPVPTVQSDADTGAVDESGEPLETATGSTLENGTSGTDAANATVEQTTATNGSVNGTTNGSADGSTSGSSNAAAEGNGSTGGLVPGFGVGAAVTALAVAALAARRRSRR